MTDDLLRPRGSPLMITQITDKIIPTRVSNILPVKKVVTAEAEVLHIIVVVALVVVKITEAEEVLQTII